MHDQQKIKTVLRCDVLFDFEYKVNNQKIKKKMKCQRLAYAYEAYRSMEYNPIMNATLCNDYIFHYLLFVNIFVQVSSFGRSVVFSFSFFFMCESSIFLLKMEFKLSG